MARKCYISFKTEDIYYKNYILTHLDVDMIDKSLSEPINSNDEDYIMRVIRQDYLSDSTVTIHLIGLYGAENRGAYEQRFIKRELQASLYHGAGNTQNGLCEKGGDHHARRRSSIRWPIAGSEGTSI